MITIPRAEATIRVRLNQEKLLSETVNLNFTSPSRAEVELEKELTTIVEGVYTFEMLTEDYVLLIDDTYDYIITQGGTVLKTGSVRVQPYGVNTGSFDYTLDFTLS